MNTVENVQAFETLLSKVSRVGINDLIEYIRNSDFYKAPASTRYHLSVEGGLLQHSLNVYRALKGILKDTGNGSYSYLCDGIEVASLSEENLIIISLLHDICKVNSYAVEKRNRKNDEGVWEEYDFYITDEKFPYGHGEKSVLIISNFIKLSDIEQMSIRWHMGFPDEFAGKMAYGSAVEKYPVIIAVNTADMLASRIMESKETNNNEWL